MSLPEIDVVLASPRGFCAGVVRAIETVKLTLQAEGAPVFVLHEIVHNRHVLAELEQLGARFVKDLGDIAPGGICIFSAHGISRDTEHRAEAGGLRTIDATCPLVNAIHRLVEQYHGQGYDVIIIGHHGHPEVVGTAGRVEDRVHVVADAQEASQVVVTDIDKVAYVTQTTLSQRDVAGVRAVLQRRFPNIKGPAESNICYATQNRQDAVRQLAARAELIFVVGSKNSSNSNRLKEVAEGGGCRSYLIDDRQDLQPQWLNGVASVGITAGASAPERLVEGVLDWLEEHAVINSVSELLGKDEHIKFRPARPYRQQ
jgi:4-hydroxy-3-methylbut-2-en-1-yl diphosphate reductase